MVADQSQVQTVSITAEDQHGDPVEVEGVGIPLVIGTDEIPELLAEYDPAASASPSAANSRIIARVVMDALRRYEGL